MFEPWYEDTSRDFVLFKDIKFTRYGLASLYHPDTPLQLTLYASNGYIEVRIYALTFAVVASHTANLGKMQLEISSRLISYASNGYIEVSIYALAFVVVASHTADLVRMQLETST